MSVLIHKLWWNRNNYVFKNKREEAEEIVKKVEDYLEEIDPHMHGAVSSSPAQIYNPPPETAPKNPPEGWVILNTDAAWNQQQGKAATGGILRDYTGIFIAGKSTQIPFPISPKAAEAEAMLEGIKLALERNCQRIWIETDSIAISNALKDEEGRERNKRNVTELGRTLEDCISLLEQTERHVVVHVQRKWNVLADRTAKYGLGLDLNQSMVWTDAPPPWAIDAILSDVLGRFNGRSDF